MADVWLQRKLSKIKDSILQSSNDDRQRMYHHLQGSSSEIGYLEATEEAGRKYRQNLENYLTSNTWKRPLEEREMLNIELV